jgi:hypothetical protein
VLVQLKSADVSCGKATLRTTPSSGQATTNPQLRHLKLPACHSRAAFEGSGRRQRYGGMGGEPRIGAVPRLRV